MNKSKFLKKSLAMVLAIMMVVAMIPVGASAAETPVVTGVTVNGIAATASGTAYTAEIDKPGATVTVKVTLKNGNGIVTHATNAVTEPGDGTSTFTMTNEEIAAKSADFRVFSEDLNLAGTYTVKFTVKQPNRDSGVKEMSFPNHYGVSESNGLYTVVVPYGTNATTTGTELLTIKTNSTDAVVTSSGASVNKVAAGVYTLIGITLDTETAFVVTAQDGSQTSYNVKLQKANAFSSFSVKGESKDAEIYGITTDFATKNTINIYMPYGTKADETDNKFYITPEFAARYGSLKVTAPVANVKDAEGSDPVALVSGETVLDFGATLNGTAVADHDTASVTLTVTYTDAATETWTVNLCVPKKDPVAEVKSLSLGAFKGVIDGTTITLEVPAAKRNSTTTPAYIPELVVGVSTDSVVQLVGTDIASVTATSDTAKLKGASGWLDDGKDTFTLRVKSADTKSVVDYTLNVKTAAASPASISSMILEKVATGDQYTAEINQSTGVVTFSVPYSVNTTVVTTDFATKWKMYYTLSSGAVLSGYSAASGDLIGSNTGVFPTKFDGATYGSDITVATADVNTKTYKIAMKNKAASSVSAISDVKIVKDDVTKFSAMTDANSVKVSGTNMVASIPFKDATKYTAPNISATLPEGAALYWVNATSDVMTKLDVLAKDTTSAAASHLPTVSGAYDGDVKNTDGSLKTLKLVCVAEGAVSSITDKSTTFKAFATGDAAIGQFTAYSLIVKQNKAREVAYFDSVSIYNKATDVTVNATTDNTNHVITLKVPYNFNATSASANANLYLDFVVRNGETVTVDGTEVNPIARDSEDAIVDKDSTKLTAGGNATTPTLVTTTGSKDVLKANTFVITSEDGKKVTPYTVVLAYEPANTVAALESVTIGSATGRPDAKGVVTVNLPYGSEVTALTPKFITSANAYITYLGNPIVRDAKYNFVSDKTFVVHSEDGLNTTTYTVKVTVSDQFTDVKTTDWFYKEVMRAASLGIVGGVGDGRFNPNGNVTRGQFALMVARMEGFNQADYADKTPFSDVKAGTEMAAAIAYCADKGYIGGYSDTTFKPSKNIKREEMAKIVSVAMGYEEYDAPDAFADDASISSWAKDYVYACVANGMLGGVGNNMYKPQSTTTRAQAATVVVRMYDAK